MAQLRAIQIIYDRGHTAWTAQLDYVASGTLDEVVQAIGAAGWELIAIQPFTTTHDGVAATRVTAWMAFVRRSD